MSKKSSKPTDREILSDILKDLTDDDKDFLRSELGTEKGGSVLDPEFIEDFFSLKKDVEFLKRKADERHNADDADNTPGAGDGADDAQGDNDSGEQAPEKKSALDRLINLLKG